MGRAEREEHGGSARGIMVTLPSHEGCVEAVSRELEDVGVGACSWRLGRDVSVLSLQQVFQ